jgi:hypothetical protein
MSYAGAEHDRMLAGLVKPCYVVALDLAVPRRRQGAALARAQHERAGRADQYKR